MKTSSLRMIAVLATAAGLMVGDVAVAKNGGSSSTRLETSRAVAANPAAA